MAIVEMVHLVVSFNIRAISDWNKFHPNAHLACSELFAARERMADAVLLASDLPSLYKLSKCMTK